MIVITMMMKVVVEMKMTVITRESNETIIVQVLGDL